MSKVTGPLLSFDARGQIAKTQVYANWKGRAYARRYVIPSNPNSSEQQLTRSAFAFVQALWKYAPASMQDAFNAYAESLVMTGRNAFAKFNVGTLRTASDLSSLVFSPGARSGLAAAGIALTPGDDQITVTLTAPTLPSGWSISKAVAAAVVDQDPNTGTAYTVVAGEDATDPYQIVLTGLEDATDYIVGGWFEYLRPDGKTAYGTSISDAATTT